MTNMTTKQLIKKINNANFDDIIKLYRKRVEIGNKVIHLLHFTANNYLITVVRKFQNGYLVSDLHFTVINNICVLTRIELSNTHTYFEDKVRKNLIKGNLKKLIDTLDDKIEKNGYAVDDEIMEDYLEILTDAEIDFFFDYLDKYYELTPIYKKANTPYKITSDDLPF